MKYRFSLIVLMFALIFSGCESPTNDNESSTDNSVFLALFNDEFSSINIAADVSMGESNTTDYSGVFAIYTENFAGYEDGLSVHFMVPDSSGTIVAPGLEWLIIKIQKESMIPGVYTLDNSDQELQLSAPGQVKLYYNDSDDVIHCGTGELIINELNWSNSGEETASLSIDLEFNEITLDGGNSSLGANRALGETGIVSGTFAAAATKLDISSLVNTEWEVTYNYYGESVTENLNFTSENDCKATVSAPSYSPVTDYLTYEYSYSSSMGYGTLKGDKGEMDFTVKGKTLTFNNLKYERQ